MNELIDLVKGIFDSLRAAFNAVATPAARRNLMTGLRERLVANRVSIVVSLILATAIYFVIHERPMEEFVRTVAVKVRGAPENSRIGIDPPTVRVVFRGAREDMLGLDMSPPVIYVQYSSAVSNETGVVVKLRKKTDVRIPGTRGLGAVTVVSLEPEEVQLVEDQTASIGFDIDPPVLEGTPFRGYLAEIADYSPKRATVTGGSQRLKGWTTLGHKLQLPPISVEGLATGFTREVDILPPKGEDAMDVVLPTTPVKVEVRIVQPRDNHTLDEIPVRLSLPHDFEFPADIAVEPARVSMTLVGVKEQINEVGVDDVAVYAEVATNALPLSATNGVEVTLVPRIPHDRSIFEANLTPDKVTLTAVFPSEPDPEPEPATEPEPEPAAEPAPEAETAPQADEPAEPQPIQQ